ncbi:MAG: hypothetical protein Q7T54_02355 [Candidatus Levybacteria bacterium]|nr:hypothetical protein [Candidatus Levybacteria bacterium]
MPRKEYEGILIATAEDLPRIKNGKNGQLNAYDTEREFARLLLDKTTLEITYEPTFFYLIDDDEIKRGTLPDFRVRNPSTGVVTYIEVTTSVAGKGKQKSFMRELAPDVHYVVFYRDKLEAIQAKFPEYHLLNGVSQNINGTEAAK